MEKIFFKFIFTEQYEFTGEYKFNKNICIY